MNRVGAFVFGLLFGGLVGSVTGLLMAPASGDEFRNRVSNYVDQVSADVRLTAEQKRADLERELEVRRHPEWTQ